MPSTGLITGEVMLSDGTTEQVIAVVELPVREAAGERYACKVCIPKLFDSEKWVYGADAGEARQLALAFAESTLASSGIRVVWRSPG